MPEVFNPKWEYYVPSEEIDEIIGTAVYSHDFRQDNQGFSFRKRPNHSWLRLGKGKPERIYKYDGTPKICSVCREWYQPTRKGQLLCSKKCAARRRRNRQKVLLPIICPVCDKKFFPNLSVRKVCSRRCAAVLSKGKFIRKCDYTRLILLYKSGMKVIDISKELGITLKSVTRIRRKLKLPPRGPHGVIINESPTVLS